MPPNVVNEADVYTYGPQLKLNPQGATPPTATYISADNQIGFFTSSFYSGYQAIATARILLPTGLVSLNQYSFTVPNSTAGALTKWHLPEGFLLSLSVSINGTSSLRQIFMQVQLLQTDQNPPILTSVLAAGYPSPIMPISFPVGVNINNLDCTGNLRLITGTGPAPGNQINETAPANMRWRICSMYFDLLTSPVVANRDVFLEFQEAGTPYCSILLNSPSQTASGAWLYSVGAGLARLTSPSQSYVTAPIPEHLIMRPGNSFNTRTPGMDAGDQFGFIIYEVEEWLCP